MKVYRLKKIHIFSGYSVVGGSWALASKFPYYLNE